MSLYCVGVVSTCLCPSVYLYIHHIVVCVCVCFTYASLLRTISLFLLCVLCLDFLLNIILGQDVRMFIRYIHIPVRNNRAMISPGAKRSWVNAIPHGITLALFEFCLLVNAKNTLCLFLEYTVCPGINTFGSEERVLGAQEESNFTIQHVSPEKEKV